MEGKEQCSSERDESAEEPDEAAQAAVLAFAAADGAEIVSKAASSNSNDTQSP